MQSSSSSTESLLLPIYSPSLPAPSYSCVPLRDELVIAQTPRSSRQTPTGTFVRKAGRATVVLNDQDDNATIPVYGRHATITGVLCLDGYDSISQVTIKVEGKLQATSSQGGSSMIPLIKDTYSIWSSGSDKPSSHPGQFSFSCPLPSTYKHDGESHPLPPSYHLDLLGVPVLFARSYYSITVIINGIKSRRSLWSKTKSVYIPFTYIPRTRPHRPIVPSPGFFSSVKTSPEEWYQGTSTLKTRETPDIAQVLPVNAHLFIPASRIYGLKDTIPFHVQLSGTLASLRSFLSTSDLDRMDSRHSDRTQSSSSPPPRPQKQPVRVTLLRQVCVETRGERSWRDITLGEGTLAPQPPQVSYCAPSHSKEETLDWEGELRVNDDVEVGSFSTATVQVKDFIMLSLSPTNPTTSPLLPFQHAISIRLVTDSWTDGTSPDEPFLTPLLI